MIHRLIGSVCPIFVLVGLLGCEGPTKSRNSLFNFEGGDSSPRETYVSDQGLAGKEATYKVPERRLLYYYSGQYRDLDYSHYDSFMGPSEGSEREHVYELYDSPYFRVRSDDESLPERDATLHFDVRASRTVVPEDGGAVWVRAQVSAPGFVNSRQSGLNVALVLDVSEAMEEPEKLRLLKAAARAVVTQLLPSDWFALVAFDERSHLLVPTEPVSDPEIQLREIDRLSTGAGANLGAGLFEAYAQVEEATARGSGRGHVILLSDGIELELRGSWRAEDLARRKHAKGIRLSTIGLGKTMNANVLSRLANRGEGRFSYVEEADKVQKVIADEMRSILKVFATNVRLQVQGGDSRILAVHDGVSRIPSRDAALVLSDLASGEERNLLIRLKIPPMGPDGQGLVTFKLNFEQTSPVRRTMLERSVLFETGKSLGGFDESVETYARLTTGLDQVRRALENPQPVHVQSVIQLLEGEFPPIKAIALAEGDGELIEQAAFFEEFATRLRDLSTRPGGLSEAGAELERLKRDFYYRRSR